MPELPSLAMPGHLQSTVPSRAKPDTRPTKSADVIVMDTRKTGFLQGRRVGLVSAILNLTNAIIGSGVLGLPYIASTSGWGLFAIMLIVTSIVIDYSVQLLVAAASVTHQPGQKFSYELLGEQAFGIPGRLLVSVVILTQNTANMTSYIVVFKDVVADIMGLFTSNDLLTDPKFMTIMMAACFVLPISSSSRIGPLAYAGMLQIVIVAGFVFYVFGMALYYGSSFRTNSHEWIDGSGASPIEDVPGYDMTPELHQDPGSNASIDFFNPSKDTFLAMPTFCFSFVCHTALLPIYDELQDADNLGRTKRPRKRISVAIHAAIGIATSLYLMVSISGYYLFGKEVQSDVLKNFADGQFAPLNHVARIAFTMTVILSIPLQCFPFRKALTSIVDVARGKLQPMTSLAQDVWDIEEFKILDCDERAAKLGLELNECGHDGTADFIRELMMTPNNYQYTLPDDVDPKVLGSMLDRYVHHVRYGELMLRCAARESAEELHLQQDGDDFEVEGLCPPPEGGWVTHLLKTVFAIGICTFLALTVPQIKTVFAVAGATSSVWLELILPSAIYIKLTLRKANLSDVRKYGSILDETRDEEDEDGEVGTAVLQDSVSKLAFVLPRLLCGGGFVVFIISWAGNIWRWVG